MPANKKGDGLKKLSGTTEVEGFLGKLEHPLKEEIREVRKIILRTNDQLTERIKWNAPSFCINGEDRITFNLQGKGFFRLIFHRGAKVKELPTKDPLFLDSTGLLEWVTQDRAIVKFTDKDDVESKEKNLTEVIAMWINATKEEL